MIVSNSVGEFMQVVRKEAIRMAGQGRNDMAERQAGYD
jgi:hypothetical protein